MVDRFERNLVVRLHDLYTREAFYGLEENPPRMNEIQKILMDLKHAHEIVDTLSCISPKPPVHTYMVGYSNAARACAVAMASASRVTDDPDDLKDKLDDHARKLLLYCASKIIKILKPTIPADMPEPIDIEGVGDQEESDDDEFENAWREYEQEE